MTLRVAFGFASVGAGSLTAPYTGLAICVNVAATDISISDALSTSAE
jgi:hypothetical protein